VISPSDCGELTVGEVLNDALRIKVPFTPGTFRAYRRLGNYPWLAAPLLNIGGDSEYVMVREWQGRAARAAVHTLLDEGRVAIDVSMWIQEYEQAAILMTTPIVTKPATDKHGIQEAAATRDFRQHRIVLLGNWVHCLRPIQGLTRRQHIARPTC
jgi:hypothetical protein